MMTTSLADAVREAGASRVLTPDDADYTAELSAFNLAIRQTPEVVVAAQSVADVTAAVDAARGAGAPLVVLGLGHGVLRDTDRGIAVSTRGLASVDVDLDARTARIGAGTTWNEVLAAVTPHGLAALNGSAPGVGVMGYLLGGGLGPIARSYGFAADHVRAFEIVTPADGAITVDADSHPDLFWALRGGKGGFGVVTAVTIDLFPIAEFYGGGLFFPDTDVRSVLEAFSDWSTGLPDTVTASIALLRLPPLPDLPEPIRGRFVAHVRYAALTSAEEAERILAPIRAAGSPLLDAIGVMPYAAIGMIHADPVTPLAATEGGLTLSSFGRDAVDALLAAAGPEVDVPLIAVEVRVLGGAVGREPEIPNAIGGRDSAYGVHVVGAPVPELLETVIPQVIRGVFAALAPWQAPVSMINFVGRSNEPGQVERSWSAEQNDRLDRVRAAVDPDGLLPFGRHGAPATTA
ncbi:FAD-binding oxidoreductase [Herbiconiux sp. L3-i23]|uniref:FAD-binding oxidoreductase n=1 Tax=Herbiconiux sp. L3-i23 TaxID=2905871 RepID=UPI002059F857|nr:FAD-binding protein [Herbiconiux sp. L3-i23]BDI22280.1 FAD-linked oxidase [Herbiconiux sp. L3-i23]